MSLDPRYRYMVMHVHLRLHIYMCVLTQECVVHVCRIQSAYSLLMRANELETACYKLKSSIHCCPGIALFQAGTVHVHHKRRENSRKRGDLCWRVDSQ